MAWFSEELFFEELCCGELGFEELCRVRSRSALEASTRAAGRRVDEGAVCSTKGSSGGEELGEFWGEAIGGLGHPEVRGAPLPVRRAEMAGGMERGATLIQGGAPGARV